MGRLVIILACLACGGCVTPTQTIRPHRDYLCWSRSLEPGANAWLTEARQRFSDPFLFIVHGDSGSRDQWRAFADDPRRRGDLKTAVWAIRDLIGPDRDIVILSCNEGRPPFDLDIPRVWYARRETWSFPFSAIPVLPNTCAGSICEFVSFDTSHPRTQPSRP